MKYVIANHKANKTLSEIKIYMEELVKFVKEEDMLFTTKIKLIIAPQLQYLGFCKHYLEENNINNIYLSLQDVDTVTQGSYTGAQAIDTLYNISNYAIVNHSEREKYFHENQKVGIEKALFALKNNINPILCVRDGYYFLPDSIGIIAYEPISAIGTGNNMPLAQVLNNKLKFGSKKRVFLYGGSVTSFDIHEYLNSPEIDGFLIGKSSLIIDEIKKISLLIKAQMQQE